MPYSVDRDRFGELVEAALAEVPPPFDELLAEVPIEVRDRPDHRHLRQANIEPGGLLLGLYVGRPRTQRSVEDSATMPDVIYIFQNPIEQVSHSEEDLIHQVRTTVLHEIGHHFGMDEDDLEELGYG